MKTTKELLLAAADLLDKPNSWCQGTLSKTAFDDQVSVTKPEACKFCAMGALMMANKPEGTFDLTTIHDRLIVRDRMTAGNWPEAVSVVSRVVGMAVASWNDHIDRTQADVAKAMRKAAESIP